MESLVEMKIPSGQIRLTRGPSPQRTVFIPCLAEIRKRKSIYMRLSSLSRRDSGQRSFGGTQTPSPYVELGTEIFGMLPCISSPVPMTLTSCVLPSDPFAHASLSLPCNAAASDPDAFIGTSLSLRLGIARMRIHFVQTVGTTAYCIVRSKRELDIRSTWNRLSGSGNQDVDCADSTLPTCRSNAAAAVISDPGVVSGT